MKILAISDVEDRALEKLITETPGRFGDISSICSCGDLRPKYIEYVADGLRKSLYFVEGNHHNLNRKKGLSLSSFYDREKHLELGGFNMHGHIVVSGEYIFAGFGGAMRYSAGPMQFSEAEMAKIVAKVQKKIKLRKFLDFITGVKTEYKIIVLSHAPPAGIHDKSDVCHTGFKCFVSFIEKVKPFLWLHGHVHLEGQMRHQESMAGGTKVINVCGSKIIEVTAEGIVSKNIYEL